MSTKVSIRWYPQDVEPSVNEPGFHIFTDQLDELLDKDDFIHLELFNVAFECFSNGYLHVTLPRQLAVELGLLELETKP